MCLAVPTQIKSISGQLASVELGGVGMEISLLFTPEATVGDYVIVHTGFAIGVLDEEEAQETLRLLAELERAAAEEQLELVLSQDGFDG